MPIWYMYAKKSLIENSTLLSKIATFLSTFHYAREAPPTP